MIKAIVFDFGNVFINLDLQGALKYTFQKFNIDTLSKEMIAFNSLYEQGLVSTSEFLSFYSENFPKYSNQQLIEIWNYMLQDFPLHRLDFIQNLKKEGNYKLILLSNTNELHINWIIENIAFYEQFKKCFDAFYLSHEIQLRKPDSQIFNFVLNENKLSAENCLFIDDNQENCVAALALGINIWHLNPETEDVVNLFKIKKHLF